eukprot:PhF_6_TR7840/c1_g1_i2/m.11393
MNVTSTTITNTATRIGDGGAISQFDKVSFFGVKLMIQNSTSGQNGGAINQQDNSIMNVTLTTITNTATRIGDGGAISQFDKVSFFGVKLMIRNSTAGNHGGAIYQGGNPSAAGGNVGAIYRQHYNSTQGPHLTVIGTLDITGCHSVKGGGMIISTGAEVFVFSLSIRNCTADEGAGVYVSGTLNISRGSIVGNTARLHGGGMYLQGPSVITLGHSVIQGNIAERGYGGGVYMDPQVSLMTTTNSSNIVITNNTGMIGGGVYINLPQGMMIDTFLDCESFVNHNTTFKNRGVAACHDICYPTSAHAFRPELSSVIPSPDFRFELCVDVTSGNVTERHIQPFDVFVESTDWVVLFTSDTDPKTSISAGSFSWSTVRKTNCVSTYIAVRDWVDLERPHAVNVKFRVSNSDLSIENRQTLTFRVQPCPTGYVHQKINEV